MNFIVFYFACGIFLYFCQFILLMKKHSVLLKSANTYIKRASCQTHAILYTHMQFSKTIFDTCFNASNLHFRRIFTMNLRFKTNFGVKNYQKPSQKIHFFVISFSHYFYAHHEFALITNYDVKLNNCTQIFS